MINNNADRKREEESLVMVEEVGIMADTEYHTCKYIDNASFIF
jgi:hypothetical protein